MTNTTIELEKVISIINGWIKACEECEIKTTDEKERNLYIGASYVATNIIRELKSLNLKHTQL